METKPEYTEVRGLLTDAQRELEDLFHHGLLYGERQEQSLHAMSRELVDAGLQAGAALADALTDELVAARINPAWEVRGAALAYTAFWQYLKRCQNRLNFLEARANIRDN